MNDVETNFIDNVECVKVIINNKLNKARENFNKEKTQQNKKEYLELISDMRKLNLLDKEIIKKYLNGKEKI